MTALLATDGSIEATTAVETANRLIRHADRKFDLLCVAAHLPKKRWAEEPTSGYERRALRDITQILAKARTSASSEGIINLLPEIGSPAGVIVGRAEDCDLTVIGSKGRGTTGEVGLGPVASRVAEHPRGAVLVARKLRSEEGLRILVAIDGSAAAFHAVETLCDVFDLTASEVCLMHVAETPWSELGLEEDWVTYSEGDKEHSDAGVLEQEMVREWEALLEQARDLLRPYRVSVTTRIDEGAPANEILSESERGQYDLIVVGATGCPRSQRSDARKRVLKGRLGCSLLGPNCQRARVKEAV
jgi:nucleotide-binding universal stress UspA family protein